MQLPQTTKTLYTKTSFIRDLWFDAAQIREVLPYIEEGIWFHAAQIREVLLYIKEGIYDMLEERNHGFVLIALVHEMMVEMLVL